MDPSCNHFLEAGESIVKPPDRKDISLRSPDDYITKLDEIGSPRERLKKLFISTIDISTEPTHEALWIRQFFITGAIGGFFAGALLNGQDIHDDYVRQHNASVFQNKYIGNRHFWDTLVYRLVGRGSRYSFRAAVLTTAVASIGISSITYRGGLHLPDWIVCYPAFGALTRLWLGPRAMAAGAVIWLGLGLFGFGSLRLLEMGTNISISEMEYHSHVQWLNTQKFRLNQNHMRQEQRLVGVVQDTMKNDQEIDMT